MESVCCGNALGVKCRDETPYALILLLVGCQVCQMEISFLLSAAVNRSSSSAVAPPSSIGSIAAAAPTPLCERVTKPQRDAWREGARERGRPEAKTQHSAGHSPQSSTRLPPTLQSERGGLPATV